MPGREVRPREGAPALAARHYRVLRSRSWRRGYEEVLLAAEKQNVLNVETSLINVEITVLVHNSPPLVVHPLGDRREVSIYL